MSSNIQTKSNSIMSDARPYKHCNFCLTVHGRVGMLVEEVELDMTNYWARIYQRGRYVEGQYVKAYRCNECGFIQLVGFDGKKVKEEK